MKLHMHVFLLLPLVGLPLFGMQRQEPIKYFNMATVRTIQGEVIEIRQEEIGHQNPFVVIVVREKKSGVPYRIEVSPDWFFQIDLLSGNQVEVNGSDLSTDTEHLMMAASIIFQGEHYLFRDQYGFPLWRGPKGIQGKNKARGRQYRRGKE